jgi:hypothetical protein
VSKFKPRRQERREEKQALREAGAQAFRDGLRRTQRPNMGFLDAMQWDIGYDCAEIEARNNEEANE